MTAPLGKPWSMHRASAAFFAVEVDGAQQSFPGAAQFWPSITYWPLCDTAAGTGLGQKPCACAASAAWAVGVRVGDRGLG